MAKYYGKVGFVKQEETAPSVYEEKVTEKVCYGEFVRDSRHWNGSESLHDNITFNHTISILADEYVANNFGFARYVTLSGVRVAVTNIEYQRPRLILTLGGLYNGSVPDED